MDYQFKYWETMEKFKVVLQKFDLSKIAVSFSGGKDSTILLHFIEQLGFKNKVKVVFFNTYMEYEATYRFVELLRSQGWIIDETKPKIPAPIIYNQYGKPLQSKVASEMINRLQKHNFNFKEDTLKDYEDLSKKYSNCDGALRWLTGHGRFMIKCSKWLKRQLVNLDFKISSKCCEYLKKQPVYKYNKDNNIELSIIGIRAAEGGARKYAYTKGCFIQDKKPNKFLPLLNFTDKDIKDIVKWKNIKLSDCYEIYGLERTGCVGCPFAKNYKQEIEICEKYEPNKALALKKLFGDVYRIQDKKNEKNENQIKLEF